MSPLDAQVEATEVMKEATTEEPVEGETGSFTCDKCGKEYTTKYTLEVHLRWHNTDERLFQCADCEKRYRSAGGLKEHFILCHREGNAFPCKQCHKIFGRKDKLKEHLQVHTNVRPYKCKDCGFSFKQISFYMSHLKEHKQGTPLHCNICNKKFKCKRSLKKHAEKCKNKQIISKYLEVTPEVPIILPFQCIECEESYKSIRRLKEHFILWHKVNQFQCFQCHKTFGGQHDLKDHMQEHKHEKPFICDKCGRSFSLRYKLTDHLYVHTDSRSFHCNICNNNFKFKRNIKSHKEKCGQKQRETEVMTMADLFEEEIKQLSSKEAPKTNNIRETSVESNTEHALEETVGHDSEELEYDTLPESGVEYNERKGTIMDMESMKETNDDKDDLEHPKREVDADIFTTEELPNTDCQTDGLEEDFIVEELTSMVKFADEAEGKMRHLNIQFSAKIYVADGMSVMTENEYNFNESSICRFVCPKCSSYFLSLNNLTSHSCK